MKIEQIAIASHATKNADGSTTLTVTGDDFDKRIAKGTKVAGLEYAKDSKPIPPQDSLGL